MKSIFVNVFIFLLPLLAQSVDCDQQRSSSKGSKSLECLRVFEKPDESAEGIYSPFKGDIFSNIKNCQSKEKNFELVEIYSDDHELSDLERGVGGLDAYPWYEDLEGEKSLEMFGTKVFLKRVFNSYSEFKPPELLVEVSNQLACREINTEVAFVKRQFNYLYASGQVVSSKIIKLDLRGEIIKLDTLRTFIKGVNDTYRSSFDDKVTYFNPNMVQQCVDDINCSCCGTNNESAASDIEKLKKSSKDDMKKL